MKRLIVLLVILALAGCSKVNYIPPIDPLQESHPKNITYNLSEEQLWKTLLPRLSLLPLDIKDTDKKERLILLGYEGDPEQYVDCGVLVVDDVSHPFAKSYIDTTIKGMGKDLGPKEVRYQTSMELEYEAQLKIIPVDKEQTILGVKTKYTLHREVHSHDYNPDVVEEGEQVTYTYFGASKKRTKKYADADKTKSYSIDFAPGETKSFPTGTGECLAKNVFEKELFEVLEGIK